MATKTMMRTVASTVTELIDALNSLVENPDTTYVNIDGKDVTVELREETLTDGSKVEDVVLMRSGT